MKKTLRILIAFILIASMLVIPAFAETRETGGYATSL